MKIFRRHRVQTLAEWLEIATDKLVMSAKKRISAEILTHYAEAVAGYVRGGLAEHDAELRAVAELGNAKTAARRFRKGHLTEFQARNIELGIKTGHSAWMLALQCFMFAFFVMKILISSGGLFHVNHPLVCLSLLLVVLVVLPVASFAVARFGAPAKRPLLLLLIQAGSGPFVALLILAFFVNGSDAFDQAIEMSFALAFFAGLLPDILLWKKLPKCGDVADEISPTISQR